MIICHKYRFIFLKTAKTAGTSIEIALSKFCGEDDVITPITAADEEIRTQLGYRGPQNYLADRSEYGLRDWWRLFYSRREKMRFYNHIPASQARPRIGEEIWNSYYKFCFERNPWDRCISLYYWKYKQEPRPDFTRFLRSEAPRILKRGGIEIYTIDGKVVADRVCKLEHRDAELRAIEKKLGLPGKLELPNAKGNFRKDRRPYQEVLTPEQRAIIDDMFQDEIQLHGYQFDQPVRKAA